jgi:hypothetical protein
MPRFFFHLRNDVDVADEEGTELPDLESAESRAVDYAVDMSAASILENRRLTLSHSIEVADESGRIVKTVRFGDAFTLLD